MMDLNKIKFCNIVKLLMGHVQKKIFFSDILLIILFVTCQHIYDCFLRYLYMNK